LGEAAISEQEDDICKEAGWMAGEGKAGHAALAAARLTGSG